MQQTREMSDEQRLVFHQQHSGPVLASLREWLDEQIKERLVEPNSSLGRAFAYLLKALGRINESADGGRGAARQQRG
ncbi:MAG: transposase [Pyrinomonadaceae bacterium]